MDTVLLSDAHLDGPDDPAQIELLGFLARARFAALVIVGDLFDLWLAPPARVPAPAQPVIDALERIAVSGRAVTWLGGNHDPAPRLPGLALRIGRRWQGVAGGQRVLAIHGDGGEAGLADRGLRRLLESRRVAHAAQLVGERRLWRAGRRLSDLSRARYGDDAPGEALRRQIAYADRLLAQEGHQVVVMGHTHAPGELALPHGRFVNLGDWYEHRTFARAGADGVRLWRWDGQREVALEPGPPSRRPALLRRAQRT